MFIGHYFMDLYVIPWLFFLYCLFKHKKKEKKKEACEKSKLLYAVWALLWIGCFETYMKF